LFQKQAKRDNNKRFISLETAGNGVSEVEVSSCGGCWGVISELPSSSEWLVAMHFGFMLGGGLDSC
jgi:hypothetical protein